MTNNCRCVCLHWNHLTMFVPFFGMLTYFSNRYTLRYLNWWAMLPLWHLLQGNVVPLELVSSSTLSSSFQKNLGGVRPKFQNFFILRKVVSSDQKNYPAIWAKIVYVLSYLSYNKSALIKRALSISSWSSCGY